MDLTFPGLKLKVGNTSNKNRRTSRATLLSFLLQNECYSNPHPANNKVTQRQIERDPSYIPQNKEYPMAVSTI